MLQRDSNPWSLRCGCNAGAMLMQCWCNAGAMRVQCWCNAGAMLMQCWCNAAAMLYQLSYEATQLETGARFSKVPETSRVRKAICETANRMFWKADLLSCFQGNKKKRDCEVWRLKSFPFLRYKENCDTRRWPVKFRDFRETGPRSVGRGFESRWTLAGFLRCL